MKKIIYIIVAMAIMAGGCSEESKRVRAAQKTFDDAVNTAYNNGQINEIERGLYLLQFSNLRSKNADSAIFYGNQFSLVVNAGGKIEYDMESNRPIKYKVK